MQALLAAALFALLAVGAVVAVLVFWNRSDEPPSSSSPSPTPAVTPQPSELSPSASPSPPPPPASPPPVEEEPAPTEPTAGLPDDEPWPTFGRGRGRIGFARAVELVPPFDEVWSVDGEGLLLFPPVVAYGHVFAATSRGRVMAVDAESGQVLWEVAAGRCIAGSPAAANKVLLVSLMDPAPCKPHDRGAPGYVAALTAATGDEIWRFEAGVIESSPLVVGNRVFVGSWDNSVYAIDVETGEEIWSYETEDRIRGGATFGKGRIYIAGDDDMLYALSARDGELAWSAKADGNFRTTPVISAGRVFIGNADGNVYAFDAEDGEELWTYAAGGPVFGTPAIRQNTVYGGSEAGQLFALNAATGDLRWSFDAASPILGSPTVFAEHVYISTGAKKVHALNAQTGEEVWSFDDGRRASLVADSARVYLSGSRTLYALEPASEDDALDEESMDKPPSGSAVEKPGEEERDSELGAETAEGAGERDDGSTPESDGSEGSGITS